MEGLKTHKLSMKDINVEFPGVKALTNVSFNMESGHIYALIGANGAGKSTLMKVLSGVNSHYTGSILIDGEECEIRSPKAAKELGIEIVYQEVDVALTPNLSVAENIMLNTLANKMGKKQFVNWAEIRQKSGEALKKLGVDIDVRKRVAELSLAERQMVLIARAAMEQCKFLVLDEPTAPLSHTETENLFKTVQHLAEKENVGIVFISHRLAELFEICEYITIMKDGQVVKDMPITPELTINNIIQLMLGRMYDENYPKKAVEIGGDLLELQGLTERDNKIKDISLTVKKGEIVGIAGLVGAGKTELCKTIFGALQIKSGNVVLNGSVINPKNPTRAVKSGIALVPEERRREGVLVKDTIYSNLTLPSLQEFLSKIGFVVKSRQLAASRSLIGELDIKTPSESQTVALLSGGNQQKVAVGKWLLSDAEIYIFDEPTKGVDVGAKREIFKLIENLAEKGKGVIYASCEFSEIMAVADRTYVMFDGEIVREAAVKDTNENELLYYATGGH
ncbi:MAG TPA: ABC transporter [Ruminococcaceae bacterium]|nr:ABC transporter [Oscillospiraceae bacterium]